MVLYIYEMKFLSCSTVALMLGITGCCSTVPISPMPNQAASIAGTAATKKNVTNTKNLIKKAQDAAAKGDTSIDRADALISAVLAKP
jgi:hypothetical protein